MPLKMVWKLNSMEYFTTYESIIGLIYLTSDGIYLTGLFFNKSYDALKHKEELIKKDMIPLSEVNNGLYFTGKDPSFEIKYKINNLTPFRKLVIDCIKKIPYGNVITYNDIAKEIAKIKGIKKMSAQAVGSAVGFNPICIIIPCHRVIGTNNNLVGYGGGINNKIKLLEIEHIDTSKFIIPTKGNKLWIDVNGVI